MAVQRDCCYPLEHLGGQHRPRTPRTVFVRSGVASGIGHWRVDYADGAPQRNPSHWDDAARGLGRCIRPEPPWPGISRVAASGCRSRWCPGHPCRGPDQCNERSAAAPAADRERLGQCNLPDEDAAAVRGCRVPSRGVPVGDRRSQSKPSPVSIGRRHRTGTLVWRGCHGLRLHSSRVGSQVGARRTEIRERGVPCRPQP